MSKSYKNNFKFITLSLFILAGGTILYAIVPIRLDHWYDRSPKVSAPVVVDYRENPSFGNSFPVTNDKTTIISIKDHAAQEIAEFPASHPALFKLALRGIVNGGMENAQAIIEDMSERKQRLYIAGDTIEGGIITNIMKEKVVIHLNGRDEILTMVTASPSEEKSGHSLTVVRSDLEKAFEDINNLISQVSIKPHVLDDGTGGLLIKGIKPGSLFEKLGFNDGDIIQEINGTIIQNPHKLAAIYEGLKFVPLDIFSFEDLGSKTGELLLWIDNQAGGVVKEVSKVHKKVETGEDIPVRFTRNGNKQTITFSVE